MRAVPGAGREVRVPLPDGNLPLSVLRGERGLGGEGVPVSRSQIVAPQLDAD